MNYFSFVPGPVRTRIIQFLVSKGGQALVPLIAAGVAVVVAKFSAVFPGLESMIDQQALVTIIWGMLVVGINWACNHWLTKDAKVVQEALVRVGAELDVDGWVGDETVKAIEAQGIEVRRAVPADEKSNL